MLRIRVSLFLLPPILSAIAYEGLSCAYRTTLSCQTCSWSEWWQCSWNRAIIKPTSRSIIVVQRCRFREGMEHTVHRKKDTSSYGYVNLSEAIQRDMVLRQQGTFISFNLWHDRATQAYIYIKFCLADHTFIFNHECTVFPLSFCLSPSFLAFAWSEFVCKKIEAKACYVT